MVQRLATRLRQDGAQVLPHARASRVSTVAGEVQQHRRADQAGRGLDGPRRDPRSGAAPRRPRHVRVARE